MDVNNFYKIILVFIFCTGGVGCGSGGGGGSGDSGSGGGGGSAIFQNFTANSTVSNICRNFTTPTDSVSCASAGGTWATRSAFSISTGSVDGSYNAVCSSGAPTVTCRLDSVSFSPTAGLSISSTNACEDAGGSVVVTCATAAGTEDYCNISAPSTAPDCTARSGTFYNSLQTLTGQFNNESISVGTNTMNIVIDMLVDSVDPRTLNPQNPIYMTTTVRIQDTFNNTFWTSSQTLTTGTSFGGDINTPTFSITSPLRINNGLVSADTAVLYFQ